MDKWLNLSKKGHDADCDATKSPQAESTKSPQSPQVSFVLTNRHLMSEKKYDESSFNLALHLKIVMVVKNLFV